MSDHVPAYQDPRFMQGLPPDRTWALVAGDKYAPNLLYRDADGAEALVPNVWYNQPQEWRDEAARFYAERADEFRLRREAEENRRRGIYGTH